MKVKFVTFKSNRAAFENDLAPFRTKGNLQMVIRDHAKDEKCIWIELNNNKNQMQDNFRRYLNMRADQKMLRSLKIEEIDGMGYATLNGVRQEVKA